MSYREGSEEQLTVYLTYERCFGSVVGPLGAYYSLVRYTKGGIEYEVLIENDEIQLLEDLNEYDDNDD